MLDLGANLPQILSSAQVYRRLTGLRYPTEHCRFTPPPHTVFRPARPPAENCHEEFWEGASSKLLDLVRKRDSWVFSYFGYPKEPGSPCAPAK